MPYQPNMNMNMGINNRMPMYNSTPNYWNQPLTPPAPQYEIIQVSGENGVDAFQMGPNSSVLLADTTAPMIWLVRTDGAGYKTKVPYDITPHQATPPVNLNDIEERLTRLEELYAKQQPNNKQSRKSNANRTNAAADNPAPDSTN